MRKKIRKRNPYGTTLIEVLIALFVFSVMALTFYEAFTLGMIHLVDAQKRLQATTLAVEQMEKIRNLSYEDVGFDEGVPQCINHCPIVPTEERILEGASFTIETSIQYVDDPDDGTLASGSDAVPNDYKRVTVRVGWGNRDNSHRVEMVSRFVPPGIEQGIPNTGVLSINVSDYTGTGVEGVRVVIDGIAGNYFTDASGNLFLIGVPVNADGYPIELVKSNYESLETLPFPPAGAFPPKYPPIAVADGTINVGNFELNPLTSLTFTVEDVYGNALSEKDFLVDGGRRLDNNASPTDFEYASDPHVSDTSGEMVFEDRSGGSYTFRLDDAEVSEYRYWKSSLSVSQGENVVFPYGGSHEETITLIPEAQIGFFFLVRSQSTQLPLVGASVRLTDTGGFEQTMITDAFGLAYFPEQPGELFSGTEYTANVSTPGFQGSATSVVASDNLQEVIIELLEE